jgi:hypothetical protein
LRVTTGLNQGPVTGSGGTSIVVALDVGDSGNAASAERDISPAPMAVATPTPFKKFLLSVMFVIL